MAAALRKGEEDDQTGKQNGNHRGGNGRGSGAPTTDSKKVGGRKGNSIRRGGTVGQSACPKPKIRVATGEFCGLPPCRRYPVTDQIPGL